MSLRVGDRVRYFTDTHPGTVTAIWYERGTGWVAEVDADYTCFLEELVRCDDE